jgi:hypothetical protein
MSSSARRRPIPASAGASGCDSWVPRAHGARPKLVADRTKHRTETRGVPQALEPVQTSLTLAHGLVRVLDAIVLAPAAEMGDGWHHDGFRRRGARQPIGHDGARHHPESLQEFAKEALRGECAPAPLHHDVEHLALPSARRPAPAPRLHWLNDRPRNHLRATRGSGEEPLSAPHRVAHHPAAWPSRRASAPADSAPVRG